MLGGTLSTHQTGAEGTAAEKVAILEECGIKVAAKPAEMAQADESL